MESITLTTEEKRELEKRGFYVKIYYDWKGLFVKILKIHIYIGIFLYVSLFGYIGITGFLFGLIGNNNGISPENYVPIHILFSILLLFFILPLYNTLSGILGFGKMYIYQKNKTPRRIMEETGGTPNISQIGNPVFIENLISNMFNKNDYGSGLVVGFIFGLFPIIFFTKYYFIIMAIFGITTYFGRFIFHFFHPLYAFGNLGEKIQKLTPQIEEQSKKIQSEFQRDMNFSVLSDGFDSLSSTFSRIIALVLKLEKIESRANKGNLFDSEKYINSLRSDIVEPLRSLKEFLETQKTKLLDSQKELTRVRVGGSEEKTENIELQSKRSESLIQELTENIEKLDMMIGKIGTI